jgi:hypothetical protein
MLKCKWHQKPNRVKNALIWLVPAGFTAMLVALPSLWYHQLAFGSPFTPPSYQEIDYFSLSNAVPIALGLSKEPFRTNEFPYFSPD